MQILELRVESPAPRSFRSMVSSVATAAESPQRRRVTSAPPSHLSAAESPQRHGNFFFPVQKSTRQQVMALFFLVAVAVTLSRHKCVTERKQQPSYPHTQQDAGRLLNS